MVPTGPEQMAPEWQYSDDEVLAPEDIATRAAFEGVSAAVAEHRLRLDRAASLLESKAQARWPDTFAGVWIGRPDFKVHVAFTRDAQVLRDELAADFPFPDDLVAATASTSLRALLDVQRRLGDDRTAMQRGEAAGPASLRSTRGEFDTDIDIVRGRVIVRVPTQAADQARRDVPAAYGRNVEVAVGVAAPTACTQFNCKHAMLGGIELQIGSTSHCSSGFSATNGSVRFVLSAAHCYTMYSIGSRSNASAYYGATNSYGYSGNTDVERIARNTSTPWRESGKFFVVGQDPRMLNNYTGYANVAVGAYLGKTGRTTGTTYGYVKSKTVAPSYVPNSYNFISNDMCSAPGDSGGAVWSSYSAYGIISGNYPGTACNGPVVADRGIAIFGAIDYAIKRMGVNLLTNLNLAPRPSFTTSCSLTTCSFFNGSFDEDGRITAYKWEFGDGNGSTVASPNHTYQLPGTYTVRLTVTDNNGTTSSTTRSVTIP